jgi:hypothetical protein
MLEANRHMDGDLAVAAALGLYAALKRAARRLRNSPALPFGSRCGR